MSEKETCESCCGGPKLIFSCSGAADVGALSDRTARELSKQKVGSMYCLAGFGGNVNSIIQSTKNASKILVIDGYKVACAKKSLEEKGITDFEYIEITSIGFEKGKTKVNDDAILKVAENAKKLLGGN